MDLKPGDVVQLKSGGPHMTIQGAAHGGGLLCTWFAGGEVKREAFDAAMLVKVDSSGF